MAAGTPLAERPVSAYRVLERRATVLTVATLLLLAALAWWSTVRTADGMSGMADGSGMDPMSRSDPMTLGLGAVASSMAPFDMAAGVFWLMWLTMMVAMMFPTIAPVVLLHRMVLRRAGRAPALSVVFAAGYLLVWGAVGVVPLLVLVSFRQWAHGGGWAAALSGVVLLAAGLYQFTHWKERCQRACRSPLSFLLAHDFGHGALGTLRTGATHGLWCLGCCWALMSVLFVVGLMNLTWMGAITAVFIAEKHWQHGLLLARVAGAGIAALGVAVLLEPSILASVAG